MNEIKVILTLFVSFFLATLASNQDSVRFRFFGLETSEISLTIFIFGSVLLGAIFTALVSYFSHKNIKRQLSENQRTIRELEDKNRDLEEFKEAYEKEVREGTKP